MTLNLLPLRTLFSRKAILPRRRRHEPFRTRLLAAERLESRAMLAADFLSPWQNQVLPADVTSDGRVTAMDAMRIINELNRTGPQMLVGLPGSSVNRTSFMAAGDEPRNYFDVNGDGRMTANDALVVINRLSAAQDDQVRIRVEVTDLDGNPINEIPVGQDFQIRGFVKDLRQPETAPQRGVASAYVDVNYDATKMAVDLDGRSIVYAPEYAEQHRTQAQITATPGLLDDIGALSSSLSPLGPQERMMFIVPMTSIGRGTVNLTTDPDDDLLFEVLVYDGGETEVPEDEIQFTGDTVTTGSPPIVEADTATVAEDSTENTILVLDNDDPNPNGGQGPLTVVSVTPGANGAVGIAVGGGSVIYTPTANFSGSDAFSYTVEDALGNRSMSTVNVTVTSVNDDPDAMNDDDFVVDSDTEDNVLDVLANDTFAPDTGETLTISAIGMPDQGGTVTNDNGLRLLYSPAAGFTGTETFTYTISDGNGGTDTATVTVTVNNDNPIARPDIFPGIVEDSLDNTLDVLANDELAPGVEGNLLIIDVGPRSNGGNVVISANAKSLLYTPAADFAGTETFTYRVIDGAGGEATATVSVTVNNVNDPPTAVDDTPTVTRNSSQNQLMVLANDIISPDTAETLEITAADLVGSEGGTIEIATTGDFLRYTPPADFEGTETFTYTISDGDLEDTATVTVTVTAANVPPDAEPDSLTVAEDSTDNILDVLANDTDPNGDPLTITSVSNGTRGGTIRRSDDNLTLIYSPAPNVFGSGDTAEFFTYNIEDGRGGTAMGILIVNITPVNDPPTAVDDNPTVAEDSTNQTLNVLSNDSDDPDDGETITIVGVGDPSGEGTVTIAEDDLSLIYTPAPNFVGTETFTYTIDDGTGMTDTATVTVTVTGVNDLPTATDDGPITVAEDAVATTIDVLDNDIIDPDTGENLTITAITQGDNGGAVTIAEDDLSVLYTPALNFNGEETFTYTISDGNGGTDTATVTVTVTPGNDPPPAVNDNLTVPEDSPAFTIPVLTNDRTATNPDGVETLTVTAVTQPPATSGGTVTVGANGENVVYTPRANFNGQETFTYTVSDGNGGTATATVTVTVTPVNDNPPAVADTFSVNQNSSNNTLAVLTNDRAATNPDGTETLTVSAVTQGTQGGTVEVGVNGENVVYTPAAGFVGQDTFTYDVSDGTLTTTQTVTVNVTALQRGSLSGFVYLDSDGDGAKDTAENPLANVSIRLWGRDVTGQEVNITTTTDSTGAYRFDNVGPGSYVIEELQPLPYLDGAESPSKPGVVSGHDQFFITLGSGQNITANNFGERGLRPEFIGRPNFFEP